MNLKHVREEMGFTQKQVASSLGINRVTLSNIENGKRKLEAVMLYKLSELYGVEPAKLLGVKKPEKVGFVFRDGKNLTDEAKKKLKIIENYVNKIVELESL